MVLQLIIYKGEEWIIAISNLGTEGTYLCKCFGTEEEVREKMMEEVKNDRKNAKGYWECGTESVSDIETHRGHLFAHSVYSMDAGEYFDEYAIHYVAYKDSVIERV